MNDSPSTESSSRMRFTAISRPVSWSMASAHSPLMAGYLTFLGNKGYVAGGTYPDENFAREIMQLYSIGLWMLHMDGTRQLDASGQSILTYDNDDIMVSPILTPP